MLKCKEDGGSLEEDRLPISDQVSRSRSQFGEGRRSVHGGIEQERSSLR